MPLTGEQIRANLTRFVARWSVRPGYERGEAQSFLNELFDCYGTERSDVAEFERFQQGGFVDLLWERVCLFEMKSAHQAPLLRNHRRQALEYWRTAADAERNVPAPEYVVLCAFKRFEIWEPGRFPDSPSVEFDLEELPDRYTALLFLAGDEPVFTAKQEAVTIEAVRKLAELFKRLDDRGEADPDARQRFLLQVVWCMFAEDLGQIPAQGFTRIVDDLIAHPRRSSADDIGRLFEHLNDPSSKRPEHGLYVGVPYVNGSLFRTATRVDLVPEELGLLREACGFNWRQVQPSIFGSLLQGVFGHDRQWQLGAHYTHEADIQKIVGPTIVEPWTERIGSLTTYGEAKLAQSDLLNYVVLDPACGSGNFLYVAYRELRRIEAALAERAEALARAEGRPEQTGLSAFFPLQNMRGIEIAQFGVDLARVTLWMGHRLAVEELDLDESTLPLADLSGIQRDDALQVEWPAASAIIGNPPFHGDRNIRGLLGDDYAEWLKDEFGVGLKDYCVYWFRKAHDHLNQGERAGLVGTNSISQNRARGVSLNYIVENDGIITDAVSSQDWPGLANVDVSIVNWVKGSLDTELPRVLDGEPVAGIDSALRPSTIPIADVPALSENKGIAFQGFLPGAKFDIPPETAEELLARDDASYADVVRPYLDGRDITRSTNRRPTRYTIDFGQLTLEEAMRYPAALQILREQAKEARESSNSYSRNPRWWQFLWPRPDFRERVEGKSRFIAGTRVAKRIFFAWAELDWRPSDSTNVLALESDFAMGVLTSSIHTEWARARSSTLEDRIRYTPSSAFETFPWPSPAPEHHAAVSEAVRDLFHSRDEICEQAQIGLTDLYNLVDEGAYHELGEAQTRLDTAVAAAYGWESGVVGGTDEINRRLLALNLGIAAGDIPYAGPVDEP